MNIKFLKQMMNVRLLKIFSILAPLTLGGVGAGSLSSCSDMLESDSERQNFDPAIDQKTDSVFYVYGILEAMQQLADQYVFQGEMRGDLVKTTTYTDNNLRQLADFSATTANKYDSAYVYYRVINNCNYYLTHRKTDLFTGSTNVVMPEYAAVMAIRAWAYLQLGRNYKKVPFFTEPLTQISQIDDNDYPELGLEELVDRLTPELEQFSGYQLPTYGYPGTSGYEVGQPNWIQGNNKKQIVPRLCMIPVDVILGELYLESGQYDQAAKHYVTYLTRVTTQRNSNYMAPMQSKSGFGGAIAGILDNSIPDNSLIALEVTAPQWATFFSQNAPKDVITYIPMAVNKQSGPVSSIPLAFGFNYYATSEETAGLMGNQPYVEEIQIAPSDALNTLSDSTEYYYYGKYSGQKLSYDNVDSCKAGDMRLRSITSSTNYNGEELQWIDKYKYANIVLYRTSTILLHLAEAFNRLGMSDAAFAILKDGISEDLLTYATYMTPESRNKLQNEYPLLSMQYRELFPREAAMGIHSHGAGKGAGDCAVSEKFPYDVTKTLWPYLAGSSPYQLNRMSGLKMDYLANNPSLGLSAVLNAATRAASATKQDTINAVEDILCDEYALEFAFEGNRYYDLLRLARHKNGHAHGSAYNGTPAAYGANFGGRWLADKLKDKNAVVDLSVENNWYLPFK